jgi:TPR repeat protein
MARRPNGAPEPTTLHLDFIRASEEEAEARLSAQRKQLEAMAAAQAERETALKKAEDAQRKRVTMARIRNIALMGVSFLVLIAGWLGLKAEQEREEAAEQRNILEAATTYMVTSQTEPNEEKKREAFSLVLVLFQRGADRGDAFYIRNLALLYQALGPAQDYTKAREWYEKAADKGDATALGNLGRLYDTGLGVTQDYTKAREWLEKAAAKGNTDAMINIGLLYANGQGVTRDYGKAREWYEKAAAKDNTTAMSNLGELYYNGQGVTRDYGKAREWYEKAAAKGDAKAKARLKELEASRSGKAGKVR